MFLYVKVRTQNDWYEEYNLSILGVFTKAKMENDKLFYLSQAKDRIRYKIEHIELNIESLRKENSELECSINDINQIIKDITGLTDRKAIKEIQKRRKKLIKERDTNFFIIKEEKKKIAELKSKTNNDILEEYLDFIGISYEEFPLNISQEPIETD